jgi:hypothetical protein
LAGGKRGLDLDGEQNQLFQIRLSGQDPKWG